MRPLKGDAGASSEAASAAAAAAAASPCSSSSNGLGPAGSSNGLVLAVMQWSSSPAVGSSVAPENLQG